MARRTRRTTRRPARRRTYTSSRRRTSTTRRYSGGGTQTLRLVISQPQSPVATGAGFAMPAAAPRKAKF